MALIPSYKEIVDLLKTGATIEAQEKIMELRVASLELQEENMQLKKQLAEAEATLAVKQAVTWKPPFYWVKLGEKEDGPYCQKCYDTDRKLVRLQKNLNDETAWRGLACLKGYRTAPLEL